MTEQEKIIWWKEKSVWLMLFLGFSAGIPILLLFSSLSLWLREAGVERSTVTFFSWAVLGYSFKFSWAPLVDQLPVPFLTKWLGRRRAWLLLSQLAVIGAIVMMANFDPQHGLVAVAVGAVLLGFASATQDIVVDAYRIEAAVPKLQAMLSATYVAGYRSGMIVAGAVAISLAEYFGSTAASYSYEAWRSAYLCMSLVMCVGLVTTLVISEPAYGVVKAQEHSTRDNVHFFLVFLVSLSALVGIFIALPSAPVWFAGLGQTLFGFYYGVAKLMLGIFAAYNVAKYCSKLGFVNPEMVDTGYIKPIGDFFLRYGKLSLWILLLVAFYRLSDYFMGVIANVFYQDMGYTKIQIGWASKTFGLIVTISGSFLGGLLVLRYGVMRILLIGAILSSVTNLLFMWVAQIDPNMLHLSMVIMADNLSQGVAIGAFIAWMSILVNVEFTASQYAIFSSLMTLFPKLIAGYSGTMVDSMGYETFFLLTALVGIPVIALICFLRSQFDFDNEKN